METAVKVEEMIKKESHDSEDVEYCAPWNTHVKEERMDVLTEFEGVWNYHELKEETREFDFTQEQKLQVDHEQEVKPPLLILVQPNSGGDDNNDKCEERDIFGKDDGVPEFEDLSVGPEKQSCAGMDVSSTPSTSFSRPKLITSSSDLSFRSAKFAKNITKGSFKISFKRTYVCIQCNSFFMTFSSLALHKRIHAQEDSCRFDECLASLSQSHNPLEHQRTRERPYRCDLCDASCTTSSHLKIHKMKHTGERPYHCDLCDASFTQSGTLKRHKIKHTGERPYRCDDCDAAFTTSSNLTVHRMKHTGKYPYQCDVCDTTCITPSKLESHKRAHTGEHPFHCNECEASFAQSSKLKIHKKVHTGERPYQCDECKASFTQSGNLKIHKRTHTGERPYRCDVCFASFSTSGNRNVHMRKHTKISTGGTMRRHKIT